MDSGKKLIIWIAAYLENSGQYTGWSSSPKDVLVKHFNAKGVPLGDATLDYIVNNVTSPFNDVVNDLEARLIESKYFNDTDITSTNLAAYQWANGDLLINDTTNLNLTDYVGSMQNLGMSFVSTPEIAFMFGCEGYLSME